MTTTQPMAERDRRWNYAAQRGYGAGAVTPPEMTPRQRRRLKHKRYRQQVAELRERTAHLSPRTTSLTRRGPLASSPITEKETNRA